MDFDQISMVPRLINSSKIKYAVLDELFKNIQIQEETVNLYIDGYYIFYKLYQASYRVDIYRTDMEDFILETVTAFLNVLGHYRRYIITRLGKNNRIFVVYNRTKPSYQSDQYPKYGKQYYERLYPTNFDYGVINTLIEQAVTMAADMCQYFEDIFVVDSKKIEDHVTIAYLRQMYNGFNIYLSRSELIYLLLDEHSCMIYPKRDNSEIFTLSNCFYKHFRSVKYKPRCLSADHALYYLALSGVKSRNIPGTCVKGSVQGAKILDSMISNGLMDTHPSIKSSIDYLPRYIGRELSQDEKTSITLLYNAINIRSALAAMTNAQVTRINNSLINLYDQASLEEINQLIGSQAEVINISDLNMNQAIPQRSSWDWDQEWGFF